MLLLRLYPRVWRERYEAEMRAVLEQHDVTLATYLDLVRGAFDAWQSFKRSDMEPIPPVVLRAAGLGVIPGAVVIATFALGLLVRSPFLVNFFGAAAVPAMFVVCLWAGMLASARRGAWRERLRAGLVAGGSAGLVAGVVAVLVVIGLSLAQVAFGLWVSPLGTPNAVVDGRLQPVSIERMAGSLAQGSMLLGMVGEVIMFAALGAAVGLIGAAASSVLSRRAGRGGPGPTA